MVVVEVAREDELAARYCTMNGVGGVVVVVVAAVSELLLLLPSCLEERKRITRDIVVSLNAKPNDFIVARVFITSAASSTWTYNFNKVLYVTASGRIECATCISCSSCFEEWTSPLFAN